MTASPINKTLVRTATAIHTQLAAGRSAVRLPELPASGWSRCQTLVRKIRRAEMKGWHLAANDLRFDLVYAINSFISYLVELRQQLQTSDTRSAETTVGDIYRDLVALVDEFEAVSYSRRSHQLSLRTESIELEGFQLGSFEIRLDTSRLAADSCYRILALEPNPSTARPEVTHPHVLDEVLCEGEGRQAIRRALAEVRLLDFFQLVAGVLRTYNDESPFVALADWHGRSCSDCSQLTDEDEGLSCSTCGDWVCSECETSCGGCGDGHCASCLASCSACDDGCCRNCLGGCIACRQTVCSSCLLDDERCPNCHEEPEEAIANENPAATPDAAVHSHCVGQAAVPA